MALTQRDSVLQMLAQLRALDPSVSAELGTPERKILDTVAQQIADSAVDLVALGRALDLDSKFGAALDKFLAIFGFERQKATPATGFVTFSRQSASTQDITVPHGTQLAALVTTSTGQVSTFFKTTFDVKLKSGETSIIAPVAAVFPGTIGNVAANSITDFVSTVLGITAVTNETPTADGTDEEDDDAFKLRFSNTVFRNVAGTEDQYLGLAISTLATKANVVGPISRYREYLQVPSADDSAGGNGNADEYTSAISTIPYSKHVYDTVPYFVSNGQLGTDTLFYRQDVDFVLNTTNKNRGDAYRLFLASQGPDPTATPFQPNVTFKNVYFPDTDPTVDAIRRNDIVLFEHSYMSSASRNDFTRTIFNAVDIFIDASSGTSATSMLPTPSVSNAFVNDPTSPYHYDNYRRVGEPQHRPVLGNAIQPLFDQPTIELPEVITINNCNYTFGLHYWLVEEVSSLGGTVRARNAIEWAKYIPGDGGAAIPALNQTGSYKVDGYLFDRNVADLQVAVEGAKQVGADVLAHRATRRYFKLDVTVMYSPGSSVASVNADIYSTVSGFFAAAFFGTTVQLSDLLQTIHNVAGVDNARWSRDLPPVVSGGTEIDTIYNRVIECDNLGASLLNVLVDRIQIADGVATTHDVQQLVITGTPMGGTYKISYNATATSALAYSANAAAVQAALRTATSDASLTVTGSGTAASPFVVTFSTNAIRPLLVTDPSGLTGGTAIFNSDFFLQDNELPGLPSITIAGDTEPGLIIRPRAQNTWTKG